MRDKEFLNSWKEVAQYVGRSPRTIQRWERDLGFPVHRPAGRLRSSVLALPTEIDDWIKGTPTLRPPAVRSLAPSSVPADAQTTPADAQPLLLCIADDRQSLRVRKAFLEAHGYRVLTANAGSSGIKVFEHNRVELVVLDDGMEDLDGEVVARMLKRRKPKVPVIMLSGSEELPTRLCQLVDRVVGKSQGPAVLLAAIQSFVPGPTRAAGGAAIRRGGNGERGQAAPPQGTEPHRSLPSGTPILEDLLGRPSRRR